MTTSLVCLVCVACSEPWKAPYESRSSIQGRQYAPVIAPRSAVPKQQPIVNKAPTTATYRVKPNDTIYSISRRHGVTPEQIIQWNDLYTTRIQAGQRLKLKPAVSSGDKNSNHVAQQQGTQTAIKNRAPVVAQVKRQPTSETIPKAAVKKAGGLQWRWPTKGKIKSGFNASDPTRKGIKIKGDEGRIVRAAEGGTIVYSGNGLVGYGELIIIKHNAAYLSAYAYNRKRLVKEGDEVKRGAAIAEMGVNGGEALLHFEIRHQGKPVNPMAYLP